MYADHARRRELVATPGTVELDPTVKPALEHIKSLARRYRGNPDKFEGQQRVILRHD